MTSKLKVTLKIQIKKILINNLCFVCSKVQKLILLTILLLFLKTNKTFELFIKLKRTKMMLCLI